MSACPVHTTIRRTHTMYLVNCLSFSPVSNPLLLFYFFIFRVLSTPTSLLGARVAGEMRGESGEAKTPGVLRVGARWRRKKET